MEKIRFRQYNPNTNDFHYWGYVTDDCFISPMEGSRFAQYNNSYVGEDGENGEELYEGDIVTTSQGVEHKAKYWKVVWLYTGFWLVNENDQWRDDESEYGDFIAWGMLTVVGNIYQTPELLEGNNG